MPKSKVRKKSAYTPPEGVQARSGQARALKPSPRWYAPVMVALMLLGLLWIVVYYVAGDRIPFMVSLSAWNFAIGFGAMVAGLDHVDALALIRPRGTRTPAQALVPFRGRGPSSSRRARRGSGGTVHRRTLRPQVDMALRPQGCPPSVERRNGPGPL